MFTFYHYQFFSSDKESFDVLTLDKKLRKYPETFFQHSQIFESSAKVFGRLQKCSLIFESLRVSLFVNVLTTDHYFCVLGVFLGVPRCFGCVPGFTETRMLSPFHKFL